MSNTAQRSFSAGELAPVLGARTDFAKYATGLRTCRNFICRRTGGVDSRPGTVLVGSHAGTVTVVQLLPFVFNDSQTYALEFTDKLVRFIRAGAYVGSYSVVTPYVAADLSTLQITQTGDVVTIVHPNYAPYALSRLAESNWTLLPVVFAPAIGTPLNLYLNPAADPLSSFRNWVVTALSPSGEESLPSASVSIASVSLPQARNLFWDAVTGAVGYNIYVKYFTGSYGFIGTSVNASFGDPGITPDFLHQPPVLRNPFNAVGDYPSAVGFFQSRRILAGSNNEPDTLKTSKTGLVTNFGTSFPTQDDDALTLTLLSKRVNQIRHIVDAAALLLFTSGGEWIVSGDSAGVLRPADANALNFSNHGCSSLPPIQINQRTLYVQARQAIVRDLERDPFRGYQGNDLTILSTHLFDGHTIVSWAFQSVPHSIVWAVRDDGVLLGLTTVAEQEVLAWHRHDTQGLVESVCVVPEGTEDALYLVVNRNGIRMTERMASRSFTDIQNAVSVDCSLPFDGRNTTSTTLTLSGGTTWAHDELLTISASAPVTWSVGNAMVLTASDGTVIRFTIQTVSTSQSATGFADLTVPSSLQNVARTTWGRAVLSVSGLDHLNGYAVSVTADGYVVANPNNPDYATITVSGGVATFPAPYIYGRVGLPFVCDLETLDIDTPSGPSLRDKKMLINKITLQVLAARGIFCGVQAPSNDSTGGLFEMKLRTAATYGAPVVPITGTVQESIENSWNSETNGRVFVRQVDPLPLTILAVVPTGFFPPAN